MRSFPLTSSTLRISGLTAAAASALVAVAMPLAFGAPTASSPSDGAGYVDSTARCSKPDTAVLFGTTQTSRVAICKTAAGAFEYRGVRVADGAKLILPAKQTSDMSFVVDNDGVKYTITPTALSVTAGGNTFRTETWTDFHAAGTDSSTSSTSASGTSATSKPSTTSKSSTAATSAPATPGLTTSAAPKPSAAASPSPAAPLPPPMAAEVGGESSSGE